VRVRVRVHVRENESQSESEIESESESAVDTACKMLWPTAGERRPRGCGSTPGGQAPAHPTRCGNGQRSGPLQPSADALGSRERAAPESFLGRADLRT